MDTIRERKWKTIGYTLGYPEELHSTKVESIIKEKRPPEPDKIIRLLGKLRETGELT